MGGVARVVSVVFLVAIPGLAEVRADGAIAVGLPANVATQGVALGSAWNVPGGEAAQARALRECLSFQDAPADTRKLCKVIEAFKNECFAIALDPKAGTPGVGWAVAPSKSSAETGALRKCKNTAGTARQQFCKITRSHCDGQE